MRLVAVSVAIEGIRNKREYLPHGLALQTPVHTPADTRVHDIAQLLRGEVKELLEGNASVGVGAESALLLELGSRGGILISRVRIHNTTRTWSLAYSVSAMVS